MTTSVAAIQAFLRNQDARVLKRPDLRACLDAVLGGDLFHPFLRSLIETNVYAPEYGAAFAAAGASSAIAPSRQLRGSLNLPLQQFFALVGQVAVAFDAESTVWSTFADRVHDSLEFADIRLSKYLVDGLPDAALNEVYAALVERLIEENPHAVYPTSSYRECDGSVESTADHRSVEAVVTLRTFASIRLVDHVLETEQTDLRDIYRPLGRCICLVDRNVHARYGAQIERYFRAHDIVLEMLVYRAMEADKGLATVERMLGDFKRLGVSRNEPVLIVGGGVLADTGGLACALYGRNTPYVMLTTSIVSGIDAGPSPRTCCDGFGYKNLLGAYHPPVVCITDRFFFRTLHEGWLRHGVAEIVKIAIVKNDELFADLEVARRDLVPTRFGTVDCADGDEIQRSVAKDLERRDAIVHRGGVRQSVRDASVPPSRVRAYLVAGIRNRGRTTARPRRRDRHGIRCVPESSRALDRPRSTRSHPRAHQRLRLEPLGRYPERRARDVGEPPKDHPKARRKSGRSASERRDRTLRISQRTVALRVVRGARGIPDDLLGAILAPASVSIRCAATSG